MFGITIQRPSPGVEASIIPAGLSCPFCGTSAPTGWLMCDGASYLRSTYPDLFAVIGTSVGAADGTHFNVPDLRGRFLRGVDNGAARDPDAAGRTAMATGGNTGDNVGSIQADAFDSHNHTQNSHNHTQNSHFHSISHDHSGFCAPTGDTSPSVDARQSYDAARRRTGPAVPNASGYTTPTNIAQTATNQVSGGNETRPINAYVNYIIKT